MNGQVADRSNFTEKFRPKWCLLLSKGRQPDAKSTNRDADGFVLWPLQHAGRASGSSEWLGRRLGGQGDLPPRKDLPSASLSSVSLSSLSSLSLLTGLLYVFSSRAAGCKLAARLFRQSSH